MDTKRTIEEIEVALATSEKFNYQKNVVVPNVHGESSVLAIFHECDMLVMSKSGYLTEIEIKRSFADFKADFNKRHHHANSELIKYFYYCVPQSIGDKVMEVLKEKEIFYTGVIMYNEALDFSIVGHYEGTINGCDIFSHPQFPGAKKLYLEQQLELARLGCMRVIGLKKKLTELKNKA